MREFSLRHHEMVGLMMSPLDHDADESERLEFQHLTRFVCGDNELYSVWQRFGSGLPAKRRELMSVRGDHALDGVDGSAFASD